MMDTTVIVKSFLILLSTLGSKLSHDWARGHNHHARYKHPSYIPKASLQALETFYDTTRNL